MLEIRDLSWVPPGAEEPLWSGVNFELAPGELVVLEGESGSGKSTFLRCIVGLEKPASGHILWRGQKVDAHNIRRFRNRVVYVHQSPVEIAPRVGDNLDFPRQVHAEFSDDTVRAMGESEQRVLLDRLGLDNIELLRRFDELSVGEQQRVALVRCLSVRPEVLLLDEATASLDAATSELVEDYITAYLEESERRAVIWVSHDREQRKRLDGRLLDLEQWRTSVV